jgi:hypothetical protein
MMRNEMDDEKAKMMIKNVKGMKRSESDNEKYERSKSK